MLKVARFAFNKLKKNHGINEFTDKTAHLLFY